MTRPTAIARRCIVVALLLSATGAACAQEARTGPEWWGNVNLVSYHLGDDEDFLAKCVKYGIGQQGHCPLGILADQEADEGLTRA